MTNKVQVSSIIQSLMLKLKESSGTETVAIQFQLAIYKGLLEQGIEEVEVIDHEMENKSLLKFLDSKGA